MIALKVNGKPRELEKPVGLLHFLVSYGVNPQQIAVGYNGEVLDRDKFAEVVLTEGDVLEIVKPVGGG